MLIDAFRDNIFPYLKQCGVILFVFALCKLGYDLYRQSDFGLFLKKLKTYIVAYAVVTGAFTIVAFIDKIIKGMH